MPNARTFVAAGTATQEQRLVITTADDLESCAGEWIATSDPWEIER